MLVGNESVDEQEGMIVGSISNLDVNTVNGTPSIIFSIASKIKTTLKV